VTSESYEKATKLMNDIKSIDNVLYDFEQHSCWLKIITPYHKENVTYSIRFQNELLKWLRVKIEEYRKEFDVLR
jgi:hypothetical protein